MSLGTYNHPTGGKTKGIIVFFLEKRPMDIPQASNKTSNETTSVFHLKGQILVRKKKILTIHFNLKYCDCLEKRVLMDLLQASNERS